MRYLSLVVVLVACGGNGKKADGGGKSPEPTPAEPAPAPAPPPPQKTPQELYAQCQERLENPQADAECKADADCAPAGCGKEVCTTAAAGAGITTTCEDKPCFKIVDTCGCHEGKCTWTLKAEAPAQGGGNSLPPSLPPSGN